MSVYLELIDFNQTFNRLKEIPLIINELFTISETEKEAISQLIYTSYTSDMLSVLPSCNCGATKGTYNLGVICDECNTPVKSSVDSDIEPLLWFRKPDGVTGLLNPHILNMLSKRFTKSGFDFINWIMDPTYKPKVKQPPQLQELISLGIQRGYNYFCDNFDQIMDTLFTMRAFKKTRNTEVDYLYLLLKSNRSIIFSDYLPLPNKALLIIEKINQRTYIDPSILGVIDAIEILTGIDHEGKAYSLRVKESRTVKALYRLMNFYSNYIKNQLAKKEGIFRKHIFATRSHFSFRAVIISITKPHLYNEIHIPWHIALTVLKVHILNKLLRMGFEYNKAVGYIYSKIKTYDALLDSILQELIAESPNGEGIPTTMLRNPSLLQGSIQLMKITKVKTDVNDPTISISILIVKAYNADLT